MFVQPEGFWFFSGCRTRYNKIARSALYSIMTKQKEPIGKTIQDLCKAYLVREKQRIKEEKAQEKKENDERLKYRKQQRKVTKEVVVPVLDNLCKLVKKANMHIDVEPLDGSEESQNQYIIYGKEDFPNFYFCVSSDFTQEDMLLQISVCKGPDADKDLQDKTLKFKPAKLTKEVLEREFLAGLKATFG